MPIGFIPQPGLNRSCWYSCDFPMKRDRTRHNRAGANYGSIADANAFETHGSRTDPDFIADGNRRARQTLATTGPFTGVGMIMIGNVAEGPYQAAASDFDPL